MRTTTAFSELVKPVTDDFYASHFAISRQEIPAPLSSGVILGAHDGTAVWIENVRGYSTGFTFESLIIASSAIVERLGLEIGPDLTGVEPDPERMELWVTTASRTYRNVDESLTNVGANGGERLCTASWWVPEVPQGLIQIGYRWPAASLQNTVTLDGTEWSQASPTRI